MRQMFGNSRRSRLLQLSPKVTKFGMFQQIEFSTTKF